MRRGFGHRAGPAVQRVRPARATWGLTLAKLLDCLNATRCRATYKAVGDVIGVYHRNVRLRARTPMSAQLLDRQQEHRTAQRLHPGPDGLQVRPPLPVPHHRPGAPAVRRPLGERSLEQAPLKCSAGSSPSPRPRRSSPLADAPSAGCTSDSTPGAGARRFPTVPDPLEVSERGRPAGAALKSAPGRAVAPRRFRRGPRAGPARRWTSPGPKLTETLVRPPYAGLGSSVLVNRTVPCRPW